MRFSDKLLILLAFMVSGALLGAAAAGDYPVLLGMAAGLAAHTAYALHRDAERKP